MTDAAAAPVTGSVLSACLRWARRGLLVSMIAGVGFQIGAVGVPFLVQRALDEGVVSGNPAATLMWAVAVVCLAAVAVLAEMVMAWYETLSANRAGNLLHVALVRRVLELDRAEVDRFGSGDLAMRGTRDIDVLRQWLTGVPSLVTGIAGLVAMVVAIGLMDPWLLLVVAVTVVLVLAVNAWFPRRFEPANAELSAAHGARADAVEDLLTAAAAVRGLGAERELVDRHLPRSAAVAEHTLRVGRIGASWAATGPLVPRLAIAAGLAVSGVAVLGGSMSVGQVVAFTSWMSMIAMWVEVITFRLGQLSEARTAGVRVGEVLAATPQVRTPEDPQPLPVRGELVARTAAVARGGRWLLWPTELVAGPGEMIGVVGPIGSGKSTLLRLLARVDDPSGGSVSYAGVDLRDAALDDVRDRITLVRQRPTLLSGTITENLTLGRPEVTDPMVEAACRVAAVDTFVDGLPERYDTPVGERGSTLSGGQVQRLALARGLLRGARVLLLDDVTSAVDARTEQEILHRLRAWMDGGGPAQLVPPEIIVIAGHRTGVRDAADRVVTLGTAPTHVTAGSPFAVPAVVSGG